MSDFLVGHALRNVWCTPRQDMQVIFKPTKINRPSGSIVSGPHLWSRLRMPTTRGYYHLYQIGQLTPYLVGLLPDSRKWTKLSEVMAAENLIVDLYVNNGLHIPNGTSYYMYTEERNLVVAVLDQPRIADLRTEPLYVRLYSNSFFSSPRHNSFDHEIRSQYMVMTTVQQGEMFQTIYHQHQARARGHTWLYVNGAYVKDFVPSMTPLGSILEITYDSTVKQVIDYPLADAPSFDSDLDLKRKYLLHYEDEQVGGPVIDYRDDLDVYLIRPYLRGTVPMFEGIYYHKNVNDAVRMVTHRDYAIVVPYVLSYQLQRDGWEDVHDLVARVFIRESGYDRPLVNEHGRIRELYKLPADEVLGAMYGTDATVPVWQAANLENSFYPKIMDNVTYEISLDTVQKAYGYNAVSLLLADTPQYVRDVNGRRQVSLPPGLHQNSTVYEYDADGRLLDFQYHTDGAEYTPMKSNCVLIEALVGRGRPELPVVIDQLTQTLNPNLNYRFYRAVRVGSQVLNDTWEDVTGDVSCYSMVGNNAVWSLDLLNFKTMVISDLDFVTYKLDLAPANGLLRFSIAAGRPNHYIPPGKIELWLNGRALIENLDYRVSWPEVVIFNKEFLVLGNKQALVVRCTGFCNADLTREAPAEMGFIKHGQLSRNGYYNLRDDKVIRIVLKGATRHRDQLEFVETDDGMRLPESMHGFPYMIENVVVPIRGLTAGEDTYSYRAKSLVVDEQVADYLNARLPEPVMPNPNMSFERYMIYSPFASTIIHDIVNGIISMDEFRGHYSNQDVVERLEPYRYLLDYDPTQFDLAEEFVIVHPHNLKTEVRLDLYQHNFVARAVKAFLDDKVDLSRFIVIV